MKRTAFAILTALTTLVAGCGPQQGAAPAAPAALHDIYIHVDPATGCQYIVFPNGDGAVREKPDGKPYCEAATAPAAQ